MDYLRRLCKKPVLSSDLLSGETKTAMTGTKEMTDWDQIVERYGPVVWRSVNRLVPNVADSEDCFQKAFISAWEFSQRNTVRNWPSLLRHMATARALERGRELARQRSRLMPWPDEGVIDTRSPDPAKQAGTTDLEELLRLALVEIKANEAEVFCLVCIEELSYREVAEQLGLTDNHVGVLLNRARAKLSEKLARVFPEYCPPIQERKR
jgi:RNA polymerase sigma-70 factor (ECF subfamily)